MKIILFGASGKTGKCVLEEALASGYEVIAYVRSKEAIQVVHPKLQVVQGQLNEKDKLQSIMIGADACISTLGSSSLTKHCYEIMDGIATIVRIMEDQKVKRFLYLSSYGAGDSRISMPQPLRFLIADVMLRIPLADHTANENRIAKSQLEWTIIRPGSLTNGPKTAQLKHSVDNTKLKGNPSISRSSLAAFFIDQLTQQTYLNQRIWLSE